MDYIEEIGETPKFYKIINEQEVVIDQENNIMADRQTKIVP